MPCLSGVPRSESDAHEPTSLQPISSGSIGRLRGFFHDGVVDGDRRTGGEAWFVEAEKFEVGLGAFKKRLRRTGKHLGLKALHLGKEGGGVQHEDAAVPEVAAVGEIAFGSVSVGLLGEPFDAEGGFLEPVDGRALQNVAVAGVRAVGSYAEQHEAATGGDFGSGFHGGTESRLRHGSRGRSA